MKEVTEHEVVNIMHASEVEVSREVVVNKRCMMLCA